MTLPLMYRLKTGPGAWTLATFATLPDTIDGLTGGAVYELDDLLTDTLFELTPPEDTSGTNLITNGMFASTANWDFGSGWVNDAANGLAVHASVGPGKLTQTLVGGPLPDGTYRLTVTMVGRSAGLVRPSLIVGSTVSSFDDIDANGTFQRTTNPSGSGHTIIQFQSVGFAGSISNVILELMP